MSINSKNGCDSAGWMCLPCTILYSPYSSSYLYAKLCCASTRAYDMQTVLRLTSTEPSASTLICIRFRLPVCRVLLVLARAGTLAAASSILSLMTAHDSQGETNKVKPKTGLKMAFHFGTTKPP
eukprot:3169-Heterococcus_DN1.PRE.3